MKSTIFSIIFVLLSLSTSTKFELLQDMGMNPDYNEGYLTVECLTS